MCKMYHRLSVRLIHKGFIVLSVIQRYKQRGPSAAGSLAGLSDTWALVSPNRQSPESGTNPPNPHSTTKLPAFDIQPAFNHVNPSPLANKVTFTEQTFT